MSGSTVTGYVHGYVARLRAAIDSFPLDRIEATGEILFRAYQHDKQVFVIGNGGSAATASHMACDLSRTTIGPNLPPFRILSLTDNLPLISALANDLGYEHVFAEQLVNRIRPGDVLISITGSGTSPNILAAMHYARSQSATNIAFLGFDGGDARELADEAIVVPSDEYGLIEDLHLMLNHVLVGYFTHRLQSGDGRRV